MLKKVRISFLYIFFTGIVIIIVIYLINICKINEMYNYKYNVESQVVLRKFPFPYRAALSICSDLDGTTTIDEFLEIQRFLHSKEMTGMGKGVNLEIGGSFFMYEPPTDSISYFYGGPEYQKLVIELVKAGYIDFLHSYGKKNDFTRNDAVFSLDVLNKKKCKVDIWVDHTNTPDNFGDDRTLGFGDHVGTPTYHADITLAYGIKFVWLGRVTMITGQSVPITPMTFISIFDSDHPYESFTNIGKEFAKNILAQFGSKKYAMHKKNELIRITRLDDGQKVYEFMRYDNYWKGVGRGAYSKPMADVISKEHLDYLKNVGGYMVVYTHLGMNAGCAQYIPEKTQNALRLLADEYRNGNIYVTTTSKLLNYYINQKYLNWSYKLKDNATIISVYTVNDEVFGSFIPTINDLQGITFYVPNTNKTRIFIGKKEIKTIQRNKPDHTGKESVTIPLVYMRFPL